MKRILFAISLILFAVSVEAVDKQLVYKNIPTSYHKLLDNRQKPLLSSSLICRNATCRHSRRALSSTMSPVHTKQKSVSRGGNRYPKMSSSTTYCRIAL